MIRRIELVCGLLAGLLGVMGLAYATFGPSYRSSTGATRNLIEANGLQALIAIGLLLTLVASVAAGAYLHGIWRRKLGLILLWGGATLLSLARVVAGFSIGGFLQPAAALGLVSAVAGSLAGAHPVRRMCSDSPRSGCGAACCTSPRSHRETRPLVSGRP